MKLVKEALNHAVDEKFDVTVTCATCVIVAQCQRMSITALPASHRALMQSARRTQDARKARPITKEIYMSDE
jgi:hypothetical protein